MLRSPRLIRGIWTQSRRENSSVPSGLDLPENSDIRPHGVSAIELASSLTYDLFGAGVFPTWMDILLEIA